MLHEIGVRWDLINLCLKPVPSKFLLSFRSFTIPISDPLLLLQVSQVGLPSKYTIEK